MQVLLFGVGLVVAAVIFRVFVVKKLPEQESFKDIMQEIIDEPFDSEEDGQDKKENDPE